LADGESGDKVARQVLCVVVQWASVAWSEGAVNLLARLEQPEG